MTIELSSGISIELNDNVGDDMELLELIGEMETDSENVASIGLIVKKIFGKEKTKVYDSIRREDGTVPIERTVELIVETINKLSEGKNS